MKVTFRKFNASDNKSMVEMAMDFYNETPSIKKMTEKKIKKTISELSKYPKKGQIMIMKLDREIVGYAILIFFWSNEFGGNFLNVDELYLKPEFRNQGVGTLFLEYLKKQKIKKNIALQLEVNPKNQKAQNFYKNMGFTEHENIVLNLEL